jgi:RimJ/RimL family protein N-acetyltransferase
MSTMPIIETPRLRLRPVVEADLDALAKLNADPAVRRFLGNGQPLDRAETWRQIAGIHGHQQLRGYATLAIESRASGEFLGWSGPWFPEGWPMPEVGWMVDPRHQGQGIATEAGRASLEWCFANLPVDQICSLIIPENVASARVAEKLGAQRDRRMTIMGREADVWLHSRPDSIARPSGAESSCADTGEKFEISSPRFRLRPFCERDLDALARLYADADVMRYVGEGATLDRAETWRQITCFLGHRQLRGFTTLAIEDQRTGVFVGECGPWFPEGWPMLEVGWLVDPRRQGQGIATEVARAALDWCFANLQVDRACSIIHPENKPSARVATKLGAKLEGSIEAFGQQQDLWIHARPAIA